MTSSANQQLTLLKATYPETKYYLTWDTPFHLLLATILSAQCTDVLVNKTTPVLFKKYQKPQDVVKVTLDDIAKDIHAITFYQAKAKHIHNACETLIRDFGGEVPKNIEQLTTLAGVGRKTANAIQQNAFGLVNGIIVDTHVIRVGQRLGWTKNKDAGKIEQDLMRLFVKDEWMKLPHLCKAHGQKICTAKIARCNVCPLNACCPSAVKEQVIFQTLAEKRTADHSAHSQDK